MLRPRVLNRSVSAIPRRRKFIIGVDFFRTIQCTGLNVGSSKNSKADCKSGASGNKYPLNISDMVSVTVGESVSSVGVVEYNGIIVKDKLAAS